MCGVWRDVSCPFLDLRPLQVLKGGRSTLMILSADLTDCCRTCPVKVTQLLLLERALTIVDQLIKRTGF